MEWSNIHIYLCSAARDNTAIVAIKLTLDGEGLACACLSIGNDAPVVAYGDANTDTGTGICTDGDTEIQEGRAQRNQTGEKTPIRGKSSHILFNRKNEINSLVVLRDLEFMRREDGPCTL